MGAHEPREVEVAGGVAADDEKIVVAVEVRTVFHTACRAQCLALDAVFELYAEGAAVAEIAYDVLRAVFHRGADLVEAVAAEKQQNVLHHGATE